MAEGGTPLRELFARFFVDFDTKGLVAGAAAVDGLFGKLTQIGSALAGGAIVGGVVALTKSVIHQGDELSTQADRLGLSAEALQQWTYVADLADVSSEELVAGLRIVQRTLFEAANGGKEAAETFTKLGINVKDSNGDMIQVEDLLSETADRFQEMQNPVEKTALAMKLFGRGGAALVPLLSKGSEGLEELKLEFEALGGGMTGETIEAANQADDAFKRLRLGVRSLLTNAMLPFVKVATAIATQLKNWIVQFKQLSKGSDIVKAAIIALSIAAVAAAAPVLLAWAPVILTTLAWVAALTLAVAALDDLMVFFKGGKSVIGDWIEDNFGPDASKDIIEGAKKLWQSFKETFEDVKKAASGEVFQDLKASLKDIAEFIKLIVDGLKYMNNIRTGKTDLGKTWLGKVGSAIGLDERTLSDKGATPLTSAIAERAVRAEASAAAGGLGEATSFFSTPAQSAYGFSVAEPSVPVAAPVGDAAKIQNVINLSVAPNAAPDPKLVPMVKQAVSEALDKRNRDLAAGM